MAEDRTQLVAIAFAGPVTEALCSRASSGDPALTTVKAGRDGLMIVAPSLDAVLSAVAGAERVGLNVGEAARARSANGEEDWFGSVVVLARRLFEDARDGEWLATEAVVELVGPACFRAERPRLLKGFRAPVPTWSATDPPVVGADGSGELVAMVATDVVRSTEALQRMGERAYEALRDALDLRLAEAVAARGGRVVRGLGDGLLAAFESGAAALDAAVALHRIAARSDVELRLAVDAGAPRPALEARVLAAVDRCPDGTAVVSRTWRLLAEAWAGHPILQDGTVSWSPSGAPELPRPLWPDGRPMAGRDDDLARATKAWEAAARTDQPRRRLLLVSGEPGIGKTRLVAELAQRLHAEGATVLFGRCEPSTSAMAGPVLDAVGAFLAESGADEVRELVRCLAPDEHAALATVVSPPGIDGGSAASRLIAAAPSREALFSAVDAVLCSAADTSPVLFVVDDLQWADPGTVVLLDRLLRAGDGSPLLLAATVRSNEPDPEGDGVSLAELVAAAERAGTLDTLDLGGLDRSAVAEILGATAPTADAETVDTVLAATGGNALFVRELARALPAAGDGAATLPLPPTIRAAIDARVDGLGPETRTVLEVAAVAGRSFDLRVVEDVMAKAKPAAAGVVLDVLDRARSGNLLEDEVAAGAGFRFVHALTQQSIADGLSAARRARYHRMVAEALVAAGAGHDEERVAEVAFHFEAAVADGAAEDAITWLSRAGEVAARRFAYEESAARFRRALELLPPGETESLRRCDIVLGLGFSLHQGVDVEEGMSHYREAVEIALAHGDSERAMLAARGLVVRAAIPGSVAANAADLDLFERALAAVPPGPSAPRIGKLMLDAMRVLPTDPARADAWSAEAATMAEDLLDAADLALVLEARRHVMSVIGDDLDLRLALVGRINREHGATHVGSWVLQAADLVEAGRLPEADDLMTRFAGSTAFRMVPAVAAQSHAYWAARTLWRGDLAAAEEEAGAAFVAMQQAGSSPALEAFAGLQYGIRREQRRLGELAMVVQLAKARAPGLPLWNVVEATVVATDRPADAAAIVEPLRGHVASVPWDLGRPMTLALLVELALSLDDLDLAAEAAGELARWSGRIANLSFPVALGPVDRLLGAVAARQGDHERAASLFAAAHRLIDGLDCVVWQAHLAVDHAAALALAGDPDPARQRLAEATAMAGAHGLTFVAARAAALPRF